VEVEHGWISPGDRPGGRWFRSWRSAARAALAGPEAGLAAASEISTNDAQPEGPPYVSSETKRNRGEIVVPAFARRD